MSRYQLTPKAAADLRSIWAYIAADNVEAADRVEEAIYDTFWRRLHYADTDART